MEYQFETRHIIGPAEVNKIDSSTLRRHFLIENLLEEDRICLTLSYYDRFIAGGIMPVQRQLPLPNPPHLKSAFFLERREIGIVNIGGKGQVMVDGLEYLLESHDALYIGAGAREVKFQSPNPANPAKFYVNSAPAHAHYPAKKISAGEALRVEAGDLVSANRRTIRKYIVRELLHLCQLQMGLTTLHEGSIWNTMPPHTHDRRMEVYFYFNLAAERRICHLMGEAQETRHIWVKNEQAVIVPYWSIHSGAGTSSYEFIWGMAGENLDYGDMDVVKFSELR
ncbi:MAG TPA: 5-dehydro-4-deoxy-D-glucuronate isomerase [Puia sp.]|nr:5-dehydro-4-deoxy-D-glucuronate isomerase [Puia sp.]